MSQTLPTASEAAQQTANVKRAQEAQWAIERAAREQEEKNEITAEILKAIGRGSDHARFESISEANKAWLQSSGYRLEEHEYRRRRYCYGTYYRVYWNKIN